MKRSVLATIGMFLLGVGAAAAVGAVPPEAPACAERPGRTGYLGVSSEYVVEGGQGRLVIRGVTPGSPAARAGFAAGDLVVAIDGRPLRYAEGLELAFAARGRRPGDTLSHTILRGDQRLVLDVELEAPSEGWEETFLAFVQHQEMQQRAEGRQRLDRLSAGRSVQLTFRRGADCRIHAEMDGRSISLPLTLAAALRVVPVLARLHAGDSLTLEARVSGNTIRADAVGLPPYLESSDVLKAIQETMRRDEAYFQ